MSTIHELARQMSEAFETRTREDGERFDALRDGSPEWMTDVCMDAHDSMLPDDWRYRMIRAAAAWLAEDDADPDDPGEFADDFVPIYNRERVAWLASHLDRAGYVDEAADEGLIDYPSGPSRLMDLLGIGIYCEAAEVYRLLAESLEALASDEDDEDDTEAA